MTGGAMYEGTPSPSELAASPGYPSPERLASRRVVVIECVQEIPCNPCQTACKNGAIVVGDEICNLPTLLEEKCNGCGLCVAACPGQAIFLIDLNSTETEATVAFPFEYVPLPEAGQMVTAVDRGGNALGPRVVRVQLPVRNDRTPIVTLAVGKSLAYEVRSMRRIEVAS